MEKGKKLIIENKMKSDSFMYCLDGLNRKNMVSHPDKDLKLGYDNENKLRDFILHILQCVCYEDGKK